VIATGMPVKIKLTIQLHTKSYRGKSRKGTGLTADLYEKSDNTGKKGDF
jgi:hypothetical protein